MKRFHGSDVVTTLTALEGILTSFRAAADCRCERCVGENCHYGAAHCSKVQVLNALWPEWFADQQRQALDLGKYMGEKT